jgi:allantoate deiminase
MSPNHDLGARALAIVNDLARFSDAPDKLTRLYLSNAHRDAANHVLDLMRQLGMRAHIDALGSVQGRWEGLNLDAPALMIASHIDTVVDAGRYDGNLGVACGLALVQELQRTARRLPFAIEVVAFGDEENVRFATELSTSRALVGRYDDTWLGTSDSDGISLRDALIGFGGNPAGIIALTRDAESLLGYLEVHIEQGPVLENADLAVGIVDAITGIIRARVRVTGTAGHAGTVPMDMRRDALAGVAEMVTAVETSGLAHKGAVATVGRLNVHPGAPNVISGAVDFTLDLRSAHDTTRASLKADIMGKLKTIANRRGLGLVVEVTADTTATPLNTSLQNVLAQSAVACGVEPFTLTSGAGHDAMVMAPFCPSAMLFVRCKGGISHNPAESVSVADVDIAMRVLIASVEAMAVAS